MPEPLGVQITGTGRAVPEKVLTNDFFVERLDTTHDWITERTGILTRHVVSDGESTATLATAAARGALDDAGLTANDIDMIIVATITPECLFPSTACFVQQALGGRPVAAFDVAAACSGFLYAMMIAAFQLQGGHYRHVLAIGAETMSRITDYQDRTTCILFGDGAGAAVLSATPDNTGSAILHHELGAQGTGTSMLWVPAGGSLVPTSHMTVDERLHYLRMQGREVYKLAVKKNLELIESAVSRAGIRPEDLSLVIPHQSNLRIIEFARERLGLPREKMFCNIDRYGNTSSASIPIGLDECRKNGRIQAGDLVLFVAFGAGFTWASALMRM